MSTPANKRSTAQKIALFRRWFSGLRNVYGTYDLTTGKARQVKAPVTDKVLLDHLTGRRPYGVYLLTDDRTRAVAVDFDVDDLSLPIDYVVHARGYGLATYIERSKRKGYHAWMFTEAAGVPAAKARLVAKLILDDMDRSATEIFPKQDRLESRNCYGNFINAPLMGRLVPEGRTVFVDPADPTRPLADQWRFLEQIVCISEAVLDAIIEINDLGADAGRGVSLPDGPPASVTHSFGLPPCAQRMLAEGVQDNQRVACFRLAVALKKAGLPRELAVATLNAWADRNRPRNGKRVITHEEIIAQTTAAYAKPYRGCGCEDPAIQPYCRSDCPLWPKTKAAARGKGVT